MSIIDSVCTVADLIPPTPANAFILPTGKFGSFLKTIVIWALNFSITIVKIVA
jgi:hypothetical protein